MEKLEYINLISSRDAQAREYPPDQADVVCHNCTVSAEQSKWCCIDPRESVGHMDTPCTASRNEGCFVHPGEV